MTVLVVVLYMSITVNSVATVTTQEFYTMYRCEKAKAFIEKSIGGKSLRLDMTCVQK